MAVDVTAERLAVLVDEVLGKHVRHPAVPEAAGVGAAAPQKEVEASYREAILRDCAVFCEQERAQ